MKTIVITGPTASGKTKLAINLAKTIDAEIISADSRIIYKDIDIAGAKPTIDEMENIPHHLISVVEPVKMFSSGDYVELAKKKIKEIQKRGKNIIVVGGSWFYIKCLFDENELLPVNKNDKLRKELQNFSNQELWQKLNELDSKRANQIHPNNKDKVIRSIELCLALNMPLSEAKRKQNNLSAIWYMKKIDRQTLYERINQRVDMMFNLGLIKEWERNDKKYPNSEVLRNTIGYKELYDFKEGKYNSIEDTKEKIKQHTRNFAKRQLTYFRSRNDIVEIDSIDEIN